VSGSATRFHRVVAREGLLLATAAAGAFVFVNHENLYRLSSWTWGNASPAGYLATTALFYVFARVLFLLAGMYLAPSAQPLVLCPECGRILDDPSARGIERHWRQPMSRKPTDREVLSAVLLRKAIDDARRAAKRPLVPPDDPRVVPPGDVENAPLRIEEFERILREIDFFREGRGRGSGPRRPREPGA